jgi:hypothetical protein
MRRSKTMKTIIRNGLTSAATLAAGPLLAHPGFSERRDVLAAAHDLGHTAIAWPIATAMLTGLGLCLAGVIFWKLRQTTRSRRQRLAN